jgi:glycerol transport system ATP-binding protein
MTLVFEGVSKVVSGQTHIHPTDLTLQNGTMNVLLGPTSSGKTSLMRLMAGLEVPNTGRRLDMRRYCQIELGGAVSAGP